MTDTDDTDDSERDVCRTMARVLRSYTLLASRPRKRKAWLYIANELYSARMDCLAQGILRRGSGGYELITSRFNDAVNRCLYAKSLMLHGDPDPRV